MNIDIEKHLTTLRDVGPLFAAAKGARILLEESLKIVKAEQTKASKAETVAAREADAIASPEYRAALEGLAAGVEEEENYRRQLITAEMACEVWRSLSASRRMMDKAAT